MDQNRRTVWKTEDDKGNYTEHYDKETIHYYKQEDGGYIARRQDGSLLALIDSKGRRVDYSEDGKPFHALDENGNSVYFNKDGKPFHVRYNDGNTIDYGETFCHISLKDEGSVMYHQGTINYTREDGCYVSFSYDPPSDPYIVDENGKKINPKSKKARKLIEDSKKAIEKATKISDSYPDYVNKGLKIISDFAEKAKEVRGESGNSNTKEELSQQRAISDAKGRMDVEAPSDPAEERLEKRIYERTVTSRDGKQFLNLSEITNPKER